MESMRNPKKSMLILGIISGLILWGGMVSAHAEDFGVGPPIRHRSGSDFVPGEIIVKFKPEASEADIAKVNASHGSSVLSTGRRGEAKRLRIRRDRTVEEMVGIYRKESHVAYAEPNFIAYAHFLPNDQYYPFQWHLDNSYFTVSRTLGGIHMETAWDITTGSPEVIVAVLDTGVAYENFGPYFQAPDLANTKFVPGFDFANNDTHPNDDEGHGTHVTGTIAQNTNNALGVAGVAFNTSIIPVKVLDNNGAGTYQMIADGIRFAADNGAKVINMSLGGPEPSFLLEEALAYAYGKGVTIVASAGNDGNFLNRTMYPAAYDAYVIAVGATRIDETRAPYSNTGLYVDIVAPGGDNTEDLNTDGFADGVLQQTLNGTLGNFAYRFFQGTSMASPHVAGVAALVIANGVMGPDNVRQALEGTAEDIGAAGWDPSFGWGLVDAPAALKATFTPVPDVAVTAFVAPSVALQGELVPVNVTVENLGASEETFLVTLSDTVSGLTIDVPYVAVISPGAPPQLITFDWDTSNAVPGEHLLQVDASTVPNEINLANNVMTATITIGSATSTNDVAITAVDAPLNVFQGNIAPISVTVANKGLFPEEATIRLKDAAGNLIVSSNPFTLAAGVSEVVSLNWDTAGLAPGDYSLQAEAVINSSDVNPADNLSGPITVTIVPVSTVPPDPAVNVSISRVRAKDVRKGRYNIEAGIVNLGSSPVSITVKCVIYDTSLNAVQTLPPKEVSNLSADEKITLKWTDSALTPVGSYTASITIVEDPTVEKSDPFSVMGAGGGGSGSD